MAEPTLVIHGTKIFDGERGLSGTYTVLVQGTHIEQVIPSYQVPEALLQSAHRAGRLYKAEDSTLLPGLIDLHVHLVWDGSTDPVSTLLLQKPEETLLWAAGVAGEYVRRGITTVRDLGSSKDAAIHVAAAIERGWIVGPRIIASGRTLIMTGGHDPFWGIMVDGPYEALKAVRTQIFAGAGVIKVSASGGVYGRARGEWVENSELRPDELKAIVEEAHRFGLKVAAHTISEQSIANCLEAGVDTIEHGHFLTPEQAEVMSAKGSALVPTLYVYRRIAEGEGIPAYARAKARNIVERHRRAVLLAREKELLVGVGSDAGSPLTPHPSLIEEIACLVDAGFTPEEALRAATGSAAKILGLEGEIGSIKPGLRADLVLVRGEPLHNLSHLGAVALVVQNGQVRHKEDPRANLRPEG